jgi:hypothetical protein
LGLSNAVFLVDGATPLKDACTPQELIVDTRITNIATVPNVVLCRIARQRRYDCVISVESEETEYCDFRIPSLHP